MFIYGAYVLDGEADVKFFLGWYMEFISGGSFTKQRKQFLQANDKLCEGMELPTKNIRSSTEHRDHKTNTQDHDG